MDNINLMGSEDVRAGGNYMREAAESISQSVGQLEFLFQRQQQLMDEWMCRLEEALKAPAACEEKN